MPLQQIQGSIPRSDAQCVDWARNFSTLISADPFRYGLTQSDAQVIAGVATPYIEAYNLVQSPQTRTPGLIARKDALRAAMVGTFRTYIRQIKANLGVDNQDKAELGIHIDDPSRTPIGAPMSAPNLIISGSFNLQHFVRYVDSLTPEVKRKPHGVVHLQLFAALTQPGQPPEWDYNQAKLVGQYSRQPFTVTYTSDDAGKAATYWGRWVTAKGLVGPWSSGFSLMIAGKGMHVQPHHAALAGDKDRPPVSLAA